MSEKREREEKWREKKEREKDKYIIYLGIFRDKTMDNKSIYIPNDDTQNYYFCSFKIFIEKIACNQSKLLKYLTF